MGIRSIILSNYLMLYHFWITLYASLMSCVFSIFLIIPAKYSTLQIRCKSYSLSIHFATFCWICDSVLPWLVQAIPPKNLPVSSGRVSYL